MSNENRSEAEFYKAEADAVGEIAERNELVQRRLTEIKQELNKLSNNEKARTSPDFDQRVQDLTGELIKCQKLQKILSSPKSLEKLSDDEKDQVMRIIFASKTKNFEQ